MSLSLFLKASHKALSNMWSSLASASLVFLILYLILFSTLLTLFVLRKVPWKSRWLVLLLHVIVRLASQCCGLSFGVIGYRNINLLVAYYVLGAEGYFTLVVCTARFLIAWQRNNWAGYSWLEPVDHTKKRPRFTFLERLKGLFRWKAGSSNQWIMVTDWLLIAANAIIVAGGSLSSAAYTDSDLSASQMYSKLDAAEAMRATGQAVFLAINVALLVCIAVSMHQHRHYRFDHATRIDSDIASAQKAPQQHKRPWYAHPTLLQLLLTWPLLIVRGIFGVLQAVLPDLNVSRPIQARMPSYWSMFGITVFADNIVRPFPHSVLKYSTSIRRYTT